MGEMIYNYNAKIIAVYDGDTVTAEIDLGFKIKMTEKIRLNGINAPELKLKEREAGIKSRDFLRSLILGKNVMIITMKDKKGKYGRYIADIYYDGLFINNHLVEEGYAKYKMY